MTQHPELKEGEMFYMNGTVGEFERVKRDLKEGPFKSIRMGKTAYTAGYTTKAPSHLHFRPMFVIPKTKTTKKGKK